MAEFEIGAAFELLTGKVDEGNKIARRGEAKPLRVPWGVGGNFGAATTGTLVIPGRPQTGRMWYIHRVVVLGSDGHTAAAGAIADIYAGPSTNPDATSQLYSGLVLPSIVEEGRYHNPVLFGEQVYAIFYNLPANQPLQFAVGVYDYPADSQIASST